ncbi:MAG TPA: hypothetical protein DCL74_05675 [Succinivibrionaceae bacterium]|nr:hypothetical protein [Succinivibrionaceae bacterium]
MHCRSLLLLGAYRLLTGIAVLPAACFLAWHRRHDPPYGQRFWQLLGLNLPAFQKGKCVVFHAASMGEANALKPLINAFVKAHPEIRTIVTTLTTTGDGVLSKIEGTESCFAPLDQFLAVKRFFKRLHPSLLITVDTELWPEKMLAAKKFGCKNILVSARMQEKNVKAYLKHQDAVRDLICENLTKVMCASTEDAKRFCKIGVSPDRVLVTGNLKYDLKKDDHRFNLGKEIRKKLPGKVLGAISTHATEETLMIKTYLELLKTVPSLSLVLVPRHKEGVALACEFLDSQKIRYQRKSTLAKLSDYKGGILIGDTMGEIALYFGMIDLAFMGGSFVDIGGHNPLEPACYGIATVTGPDHHNFKNEFSGLINAKAAFLAKNPEELKKICNKLLNDPDQCVNAGARALQFLNGGRGAVAKTLALLEKLLS